MIRLIRTAFTLLLIGLLQIQLALAFQAKTEVVYYDEKKYDINPFEMTSFSFSMGMFNNHVCLSDIGDRSWFKPRYKEFELRVETPLYKKYVSLDFEYVILGSRHVLVGREYSASLKLKLPIETPLGYVALTNSYRIGITHVDSIKRKGIGTPEEKFQLGGLFGVSAGVDYFFNQWFGIFGEFWLKCHPMFLNKQHESILVFENGVSREIKPRDNRPYTFYTTLLNIGIKTTF